MIRFARAGLLAAACCALASPALADTTFDPMPIVQPTLQIVAGLAATLLTTLVAGIFARVFKNQGETLDASKRAVIQGGIQNAMMLAFSHIQLGKIDTHSDVVGMIATRVQALYPAALKHFGIMTADGKVDDDKLETFTQMIELHLFGEGYVTPPPGVAPSVPARAVVAVSPAAPVAVAVPAAAPAGV